LIRTLSILARLTIFSKKEVTDLIERNSNPSDLTIRWIVPEVVRHERQFQMSQAAFQMLPTIERLERLLRHNLNITKDILETRVREAVDRQVQHYGLVVTPLNCSDVDWPRIILDATYRRPPFQMGDKEKGFRDVLILETFLQLVAHSPAGRSVARLAFVSGDQILRDATQSRVASATNVHVLESVDALKGLINTLGSTVDEEYIAKIKPRAAEVFFRSRDDSTLYYKASVGATLEKTLKANLKLPTGADRYEVENWKIGSPQFVKKQGQRIYWTTRFEAKLKALKSDLSTELSGLGPPLVSLASLVQKNPTERLDTPFWSVSLPAPIKLTGPSGGEIFQPTNLNFPSSPGLRFDPNFSSTDQLVGSGTATLDASWSLAVTTSGTLTKPKLESVDFMETVWGQA